MGFRAYGYDENLNLVDVGVGTDTIGAPDQGSEELAYNTFKEQYPCSIVVCIQPFNSVNHFPAQGSCLGEPAGWGVPLPSQQIRRAWQILTLGIGCCAKQACGMSLIGGGTNYAMIGLARADFCVNQFNGLAINNRSTNVGTGTPSHTTQDRYTRPLDVQTFPPPMLAIAFSPVGQGDPSCRGDCCIDSLCCQGGPLNEPDCGPPVNADNPLDRVASTCNQTPGIPLVILDPSGLTYVCLTANFRPPGILNFCCSPRGPGQFCRDLDYPLPIACTSHWFFIGVNAHVSTDRQSELESFTAIGSAPTCREFYADLSVGSDGDLVMETCVPRAGASQRWRAEVSLFGDGDLAFWAAIPEYISGQLP